MYLKEQLNACLKKKICLCSIFAPKMLKMCFINDPEMLQNAFDCAPKMLEICFIYDPDMLQKCFIHVTQWCQTNFSSIEDIENCQNRGGFRQNIESIKKML
jgi:hypothetical protein